MMIGTAPHLISCFKDAAAFTPSVFIKGTRVDLFQRDARLAIIRLKSDGVGCALLRLPKHYIGAIVKFYCMLRSVYGIR